MNEYFDHTPEKFYAMCEKILEVTRMPGYEQGIGLVPDRLDETGAYGHILPREDQCNPYGIVHGGTLYTVMDQLSGMAACCSGRGAVTLDSHISYIKAVPKGVTVYAEATPVHLGSSVVVYNARSLLEDGTLVCSACFHLYLTRPLDGLFAELLDD